MSRVIVTVLFLSIWIAYIPKLLGANETGEITLPELKVREKRKQSQVRQSEQSLFHVEASERPEKSIGQLLEHVPGLVPKQATSESSAPQFTIRGMDPGQSRYFLDGIPLTDAQYNQAQLSYIPFTAIHSVEVYREAVPSFLLADGLGGAINLIPQNSKFMDSEIGLRAGSYGFFGTRGSVAISNPVDAIISFDVARSDENFKYYDDNATPFNPSDDFIGERKNNGFMRASLLSQVLLLGSKKHQLTALALTGASQVQIPGSLRSPMDGRLSELFTLAAIKSLHNWSPEWSTQFTIFGRYQKGRVEAGARIFDVVPSNTYDLNASIRIASDYKYSKSLIFSNAIGIEGENFNSFAPEASADHTTKHRSAISAMGSLYWDTGWVALKPALLVHNFNYTLSGESIFAGGPMAADEHRQILSVSPRLGIESSPLDWIKLRTTVGNYYRAPSMFEIYGAPSGVSPSSGLKEESAFKWDIGTELESKVSSYYIRKVRGSYTYFFHQPKELIAYIPNSQSTFKAINIGAAIIHGSEIYAELESQWNVKLVSSLMLLDSKNISDVAFENGKDLPSRPSYRLLGSIAYESDRWDIGYSMSLNGPFYWDLINAKRMQSTMEHGAYLSIRTSNWGQWHLECRNLLDSVSAVSTYGLIRVTDNTTGYFGYPGSGRRLYLTWKYDLN